MPLVLQISNLVFMVSVLAGMLFQHRINKCYRQILDVHWKFLEQNHNTMMQLIKLMVERGEHGKN